MYRSILVPLDGSPQSEQALPYAVAIARRSRAALQLAYVHTPLVLGEGILYLGTPDIQLLDEEKAYLTRVTNRVATLGLSAVTSRLLDGPIVEALKEYALDQGCDLVVMTTHGRGPLSRFWLGSVADQLVHRLPSPLLLIRTREETPPAGEPVFGKMLVTLDGTPSAEQVLEPAGALAKLMGTSLTLLRVVPGSGKSGVPHSPLAGTTPADTLRGEAHVYLGRIAAALGEKGLSVQTHLLCHPHPAAAILEEAGSGDYDVLALETHGRHGLPRLFLGSVADKVVRGASVPVFVHRCLPG
jgi:nucleotide-binding universal stress UspA family protein